MSVWKLSAGTACVVGKKQLKTDVLPTTAYVMLGEKCLNNCRFCAQSHSSTARADRLARITWPDIPAQEAAAAIAAAFEAGRLKRVCLQVVRTGQSWQAGVAALESLTRESAIPVCIASAIETVEQAGELVARGADRICIALDAATPDIDRQVKDGQWTRRHELLQRCASQLPGRASTHLIVGLGESEEAMLKTIQECLEQGITVGLFAFTPVPGTAWADRRPPDIGRYRRVQIGHYLLRQGYSPVLLQFCDGQLAAIALPVKELLSLLADGKAFETSGCPDCNRPYYNERPGGSLYNYPRPLTPAETRQAIAESGLVAATAAETLEGCL